MSTLSDRLRDHAAHQIGDALRNCREAADELDRLTARVAELEKTERRYKWLAETVLYSKPNDASLGWFVYDFIAPIAYGMVREGAIDAALEHKHD